MKSTCLFIVAILAVTVVGRSQPLPIWWSLYDCNHEYNAFKDIYHLADGGFILLGSSGKSHYTGDPQAIIWIVRLDQNGNEVWDQTYEGRTGIYSYYISNIIEADNGDLLAACSREGRFAGLRLNSDGEQVWWQEYGDERGSAGAVIELKAGDFVLAGQTYSNPRPNQPFSMKGYIIKIDGDGNPAWSRSYDMGGSATFMALRETEGGIVAAGYAYSEGDTIGGKSPNFGFAVKLDENGNETWCRKYYADGYYSNMAITSMVAHPDGGFVMAVGQGEPTAFRVDADGLVIWHQTYQFDDREIQVVEPFRIERDRDSFTLVGYALGGRTGEGKWARPIVLSINPEGDERWRSIYEFDDPPDPFKGVFTSVIYDANHCGWAAGTWYNYNDPDNPQTDGLIVKLEPDQQNPFVFYYSPEDTVLYRLPGDTLTFLVRARDQQGDAMSFLWTFDGDTVGTDTTYFATFPDEYRECPVSCTVSDDKGNSTTINWHVNIVPFYIDGIQPDSTALVIKRRTSVDFGVTLRSVPGDQFDYLWRVGRDSSGVDSVMTRQFDYTGKSRVTVNVSRNDGWADTSWSVKVVGLIGDWWPELTDTTVTQGDSLYFDVLPYQRGDSTLSYGWTLNGDSISSDSAVYITFPELGEQKVVGHLFASADSDSVSWRITVVPKEAVSPFSLSHFLTFSLDAPYPNPLNQSSVVRYQLSLGGKVNLSLYDINGRLVATLVDGWQSAGAHRAEIGISNRQSGIRNRELPTGIYFLRLQAGNNVMTKKAVAIR